LCQELRVGTFGGTLQEKKIREKRFFGKKKVKFPFVTYIRGGGCSKKEKTLKPKKAMNLIFCNFIRVKKKTEFSKFKKKAIVGDESEENCF